MVLIRFVTIFFSTQSWNSPGDEKTVFLVRTRPWCGSCSPGEGVPRTGVRELVQAAFHLRDDGALKDSLLTPRATHDVGQSVLEFFGFLLTSPGLSRLGFRASPGFAFLLAGAAASRGCGRDRVRE